MTQSGGGKLKTLFLSNSLYFSKKCGDGGGGGGGLNPFPSVGPVKTTEYCH